MCPTIILNFVIFYATVNFCSIFDLWEFMKWKIRYFISKVYFLHVIQIQIKKYIYIPFFSIWYLWLGVFISSPFLSTNQSLHLFFTLLKNSQQQITNDQSCTLKPACTIHIFRRILSLIQLKVWCTYRLNELLSVIRKCKELWV